MYATSHTSVSTVLLMSPLSGISSYLTSIGTRARGVGGGEAAAPLTRAKPLFFGQKLIFLGKASSQNWKNKYNFVFIKRKKVIHSV